MKGNGHNKDKVAVKETERVINKGVASGEPMVRRVTSPNFESQMMVAGKTILDSFTVGVMPDMNEVVKAALYIGHLKSIGLNDRIEIALWKLNGSMSIGGRSRDDAVQAHVGIWYPPHSSEKEKERIAKMQEKRRRGDDDREGDRDDR